MPSEKAAGGSKSRSNRRGKGLIRFPPIGKESLLRSAVSKHLGHFPEGLVEFHILIDALDCPALGHPGTVRAAAGTVALTTANDVFLDLCGVDRYVERAAN